MSDEPADWMKCDAQTVLDVMNTSDWPVAEWPHEIDAKEKVERLLKVLAER